ncbi:winged helix-turn-helix transcriptional regulator [Amycolatopsis rhizosphaerae]|uniref:Winged helix-turn-helix transcriptional regulator n=1 Tax=Amycolatopsis rhizosphaerae TaxID=2053003 RepID=A0A558DLN4_9PSEU|nr:winged helix-turn-helix domain-containing protein [Amycolatopsis rhizosphaerae]TVT61894.1 winged helix-turn-helix transcriptional regulator [Amycolatopsis rhizosphaerae]
MHVDEPQASPTDNPAPGNRFIPSDLDYLYNQFADLLARQVTSGDLAIHSRLPGEMDLARQYGVSVGTARKATRLLRQRGIVATLRSKGTFVVARPGDSTPTLPPGS